MAQGLAAWALEAPGGFGDPDFHTHHAIQITVSFTGSLALSSGEATLVARQIAVAADTPHRFEADGLLGFIFIEPESRAGRALTEQWLRGRAMAEIEHAGFSGAVSPLRGAFEPGLTKEDMLAIAGSAVAALAGETAPVLPDARIRRVIDRALADPELSLDATAAAAGVFLSPSRLRHLFVEQTGLAFKTYMLWQRLMRALEAYAEGQTLTAAAHNAAFSASAHFSRALKRPFGLPATTLTRI
jgi:AraC-like DNA-binding protein